MRRLTDRSSQSLLWQNLLSMHHELLGSLVVVCDEVVVDHANKLEVIPELFLLFSLLDMAAHRCEVHGFCDWEQILKELVQCTSRRQSSASRCNCWMEAHGRLKWGSFCPELGRGSPILLAPPARVNIEQQYCFVRPLHAKHALILHTNCCSIEKNFKKYYVRKFYIS